MAEARRAQSVVFVGWQCLANDRHDLLAGSLESLPLLAVYLSNDLTDRRGLPCRRQDCRCVLHFGSRFSLGEAAAFIAGKGTAGEVRARWPGSGPKRPSCGRARMETRPGEPGLESGPKRRRVRRRPHRSEGPADQPARLRPAAQSWPGHGPALVGSHGRHDRGLEWVANLRSGDGADQPALGQQDAGDAVLPTAVADHLDLVVQPLAVAWREQAAFKQGR